MFLKLQQKLDIDILSMISEMKNLIKTPGNRIRFPRSSHSKFTIQESSIAADNSTSIKNDAEFFQFSIFSNSDSNYTISYFKDAEQKKVKDNDIILIIEFSLRFIDKNGMRQIISINFYNKELSNKQFLYTFPGEDIISIMNTVTDNTQKIQIEGGVRVISSNLESTEVIDENRSLYLLELEKILRLAFETRYDEAALKR